MGPRHRTDAFPKRRDRLRAERLAAAKQQTWPERINWTVMGQVLAAGGAFLIPARLDIINGVGLGLLYLVALIPVWWSTLSRYRAARAIITLGLLALLSGIVLSVFFPGEREFNRALLQGDAGLLLLSLLGFGFLLWSLETIGTTWTSVWFGLGLVFAGVRFPTTIGSPWKYDFGIAVSIIVLALAAHGKPRASFEVPAALAMAALFAVSDSRSVFGILVVAALIAVIQTVLPAKSKSVRSTFVPVVLLAVLTYAAYRLAMWAISVGYLGEAARQRTMVQAELSGGNLLAGGRPEMGASLSLISAEPLGYGNGVLANSADIEIAKRGMAEVAGRLPDPGYVDNYMFSFGMTLHSTAAEFWVRYGLAGIATILLVAAVTFLGILRLFAQRRLTVLVTFVAVNTLWNLAFSPIADTLYLLALSTALTSMPRKRTDIDPPGEAAELPAESAAAS